MKKIILIALLILYGCSLTAFEAESPPAGAYMVDFPEMKVGDKWIFMKNDWLNNKYTRHIIEVTGVNIDGSFEMTVSVLEFNRRCKKFYDNHYGWIASVDLVGNKELPVPQPPRKTFNFPLWVGKKMEG